MFIERPVTDINNFLLFVAFARRPNHIHISSLLRARRTLRPVHLQPSIRTRRLLSVRLAPQAQVTGLRRCRGFSTDDGRTTRRYIPTHQRQLAAHCGAQELPNGENRPECTVSACAEPPPREAMVVSPGCNSFDKAPSCVAPRRRPLYGARAPRDAAGGARPSSPSGSRPCLTPATRGRTSSGCAFR